MDCWPIKYLGLPLGGQLDFWEPDLAKVKGWMGGRELICQREEG